MAGAPAADLLVGGVRRVARRRSRRRSCTRRAPARSRARRPRSSPCRRRPSRCPRGRAARAACRARSGVSGTWKGRVSRPGRASAGSGIAVLSRKRKLIVQIARCNVRVRADASSTTSTPDLTGERFHETMDELRGQTLAREVPSSATSCSTARPATFFLRTKSATFPGMKIAEMFGVEEGPLLRGDAPQHPPHQRRRPPAPAQPREPGLHAARGRPLAAGDARASSSASGTPLEGAGRCEFVDDFAKPYPSLTIATVMGAPLEDAPRLHDWSNLIQRQFDPPSLMHERERDRAGRARSSTSGRAR